MFFIRLSTRRYRSLHLVRMDHVFITIHTANKPTAYLAQFHHETGKGEKRITPVKKRGNRPTEKSSAQPVTTLLIMRVMRYQLAISEMNLMRTRRISSSV